MHLNAYLNNEDHTCSSGSGQGKFSSDSSKKSLKSKNSKSTIPLEDVLSCLSSMKSENQVTIPLHGKSSLVDYMVIVTGTSDRHVRSIADKLIHDFKQMGYGNFIPELGQDDAWVLIDLGDIIVHIFKQEMRELYALEKMWSVSSMRSNRLMSAYE